MRCLKKRKGVVERPETRCLNTGNYTPIHWGGGGVFVGENSYMILPNGAAVWDNTANGLGGGVAACSTGNIIFDESVVMAKNHSYAAAWTGEGTQKPYDRDYAKGKEGFKEAGDARDFFSCLFATVSGKLPNNLGGNYWSGSVDYNMISNITEGTVTANQLMGLINNAPEEIQNTAIANGTLKVFQNTSSKHGGGILVNGYLIGGEVEYVYSSPTITVEGNKKLLDADGKQISDLTDHQFEFELLERNNLVATGKNDKDGKIRFTPPLVIKPAIPAGTPLYPQTNQSSQFSTTVQYTLKEKKSEQSSSYEYDSTTYAVDVNVTTTIQYVMSYPKLDADKKVIGQVQVYKASTAVNSVSVRNSSGKTISYELKDGAQVDTSTPGNESTMDNKTLIINPGNPLFTNKIIPDKDITVKKVWSDANGNTINPPADATVKVHLFRKEKGSSEYPNEPFATITLPDQGKWQHTFSHLDTRYDYEIREEFNNSLFDSQVTKIENQEDLWVRASQIQNGQEYLIASKNSSGKIVVLNGAKDNGDANRYTSDSTKTLTDQSGMTITSHSHNYIDCFAYEKPISDEIIVGSSISGNAALKTSAGKYLRVEEYGGDDSVSGLMASDENGVRDVSGWIYINSDGSIEQDKKGVRKTYLFDKNRNQFSSSMKINAESGNKVYLYEKKTLTYSDPENEVWQITNIRKSKYSLKILKVDGESQLPLSGVRFNVFTSENRGNPVLFEKDNTGSYRISDNGGISNLLTDSEGKISFSDLDPGTYWLEEVETIDGYQKLSGRIELLVSESSDSQDGSMDLTIHKTIENYKVYELPETGGSGTQWFTYGGLMLLVSSSLYLISEIRRRKAGEPTA